MNRIANLHKKDNWRGPITVIVEFSILILSIYLAIRINDWRLYPLYILVAGSRMYALAEVMTHEAAHGNLAKSKRLNNFFGRLASWPFFYTLNGYRRYHIQHHLQQLEPGQNNVFEQYQFWGLPHPRYKLSRKQYVWYFYVKPFTCVFSLFHFVNIFSNFYWDRDQIETWAVIVIWFASIVIIILSDSFASWLSLWLAPLLIVVGTIDYWSESSDHYFLDQGRTSDSLNYFFNRFVGYNIGFHRAHHAHPNIPFYNLKAAHELLNRR